MKNFAFLLFTLSLVQSLFATSLTWETLLKSADNDVRYQTATKRANITQSRSTKLWDKVELRYKLDGFSFANHDFELRVTPKSFGEGSADKAHFEAQVEYANASLAEDRGILIYDRYERAIHYIMRKRINLLNQELYQINLDRIEVLHLKSGSATFNPQDLMTALEKEASIRAALISDTNSLKYAEAKLHLWVSDFDSIELDTTWLPPISSIESELVDGISVTETFPIIAKAKGKMDSEKSRAKQDVASNRDYISHIGIGYSLKIESLMEKYKDLNAGDVAYEYSEYQDEYLKKYPDATGDDTRTIRKLVSDTDNRGTKDKFFVNVGIKLPFFDSNKDNDLRRQVADLDAEGDYMDEIRNLNQKIAKIVEQINALIAQWKVQKDFIEKVNAGSIFEQFAKDAGSDPLLLLRARESAIESSLNATKLEVDIYSLYLELLMYAGVLSVDGEQNHLARGLK